MESKIEKLRLVNHDLLLDYDRIEGKINEIIDHLNSQDQEEELHIENSGGKMFPVVGEIKPMSKKEWKEFSSVMDKIMGTPEEWEEVNKDIWYMVGGKKYVSINGEKYVRTSDLEQLLDEREREVLDTVKEIISGKSIYQENGNECGTPLELIEWFVDTELSKLNKEE